MMSLKLNAFGLTKHHREREEGHCMFNQRNPKIEPNARDRIRRRFADVLSQPATTNVSEHKSRESIVEETCIRARAKTLLGGLPTSGTGPVRSEQ